MWAARVSVDPELLDNASGPDACADAMCSVSRCGLGGTDRRLAAGGAAGWFGRFEEVDHGVGVEFVESDRVADRGSSQGSAAAFGVVGGTVDPSVDAVFHVGCDGFVGKDRWADTDGEHDGAVGSNGVGLSVDVAPGAPSFSVLLTVVTAAFDAGVVLVLSLIHISEPTRPRRHSRMPSYA